ncbi:urease subunit beta domain protein [Bacteroidales bacterium KA00344]|nr:urease subunit beta domain protein [Bacteroidales bacterium KA00344]
MSSFLHQKRVTETGRSGNRNPVLKDENVQKRPFPHRSNYHFFFIEMRIGLNRDAKKP